MSDELISWLQADIDLVEAYFAAVHEALLFELPIPAEELISQTDKPYSQRLRVDRKSVV